MYKRDQYKKVVSLIEYVNTLNDLDHGFERLTDLDCILSHVSQCHAMNTLTVRASSVNFVRARRAKC
jgi:hypothetical protein